MKKLIAIFILSICCAFPVFAEKRPNAILTNIGTMIVGNYELSFERKLDKHFSISASAIYYEGRKVIWRVFSFGYEVGLGFMPKIHVYGQAHKRSFYIAPSLRIGYLNHPPMKDTQKIDQGILSRFGVNFGYQQVFNCGLMLDVLAGIEHYHSFSFGKETTRYQSEIPILVRPYFAVSIGYAF